MTVAYEISIGSCGRRGCAICEALGAPPQRELAALLAEIERAQEQGFRLLRFTGHEFLSHPGRRALLERLARLGLSFILPSSGGPLRSAKALHDLRRLGLAGVEYWFSSFTPEVFELIEGREAGERRPEFGLELVLEAGLLTRLGVPVVAFNRGELDKTLLALRARYGLRAELYDRRGRFPAEQARALRRVAQRLGERPPTRPALFVFRPQASGAVFPFEPAACPLKGGDAQGVLPPEVVWLECSPGLYTAFATQSAEREALVLAKNVRGLLRRGATRYRRHSACVACPRLTTCGTCFVASAEQEPGPPIADEAHAIVPAALWATLAAGPTEVVVRGQYPRCLVLDDDAPEPAPAYAYEPWEAADQAAFWGFGVVSYELSGATFDGGWRLRFERDPAVLERRSGGLAVLQLSSACVARCVMCELPTRYAGRFVHTDDAARLLMELYLLGYQACDIFGGEITLRPDFEFILALAKEIGMRAYIITTGYNVDAACVGRLADLGLDKISIALDGPTASLHDAIKNRAGLYEHAQRAIAAVLENGRLPLEVNTVILRQNVYVLPELHEQLARLGLRRHRLFYCIDAFEGMREPPYLTPQEARDFLTDIRPRLLAISEKWGTRFDWCPELEFGAQSLEEDVARLTQGHYTDPRVACDAPRHELMVSVDGLVFPCVNPSHGESDAVGDAAADRLSDILATPAFRRFEAEAGRLPFCQNCISKRSRS